MIPNRTVVTIGYVSAPTTKHPKNVKAVMTIPKHLINLFQSIIISNFSRKARIRTLDNGFGDRHVTNYTTDPCNN